MSAIANFKKRKLAEKAKSNATTGDAQITITPANTALKLLAQLLGCDESKAIETAQEYVDQNIHFFNVNMSVDPAAPGEEKTDISNVEHATDQLNASIEHVSDAAATIANSAEQTTSAASNIESAADKASDAASDLAYQADDINNANSDLAETVKELKKPSAAPKSSNSKSKTKQKNSSKK
ncbi:hypothetical protein [Pseudoalteromonas sp.]|uniref:hypothetical protein n=1 Tax=Pseudoalteromonas sp. TaxID=53249 RepID=UPI00356832D2